MGLDRVSSESNDVMSEESQMRAPLLANRSGLIESERTATQTLRAVDDDLLGERCWPSRNLFFEEAKRLFALTCPVYVVQFTKTLLPVISMAFVGHLGSRELAGAAIAVTMYNVIGRSVLIGLASGLETLCGQAYGAGQYMQLGKLLQRATVILNLVAIPLALLQLRLDSIMLLLGQDPDLAARSQVYGKYLILGLFTTAWQSPFEFYLQTQGVVIPTMVVSIVVLIVHVPLNWVLMHSFGLGFVGPAIATSLSTLFAFVLLVGYVRCSGIYKKTWKGFSLTCFKKWNKFFDIALPACLMTCLEWWCFELTVIFAGLLPNPTLQVAALTVTSNIGYLSFMFPLALSIASTIRVSIELGGGNPKAAKVVTTTALIISLTSGLFIFLLLVSLRNWLPSLFTDAQSDSITIRHVASGLIPILATSQITDFVQLTAGGVLRGAGRQTIGAAINLGSCYFIALPVALFLAFYCHLEVRGIWFGLLSGSAMQMLCLGTIAARLDWKKAAIDASNRLE